MTTDEVLEYINDNNYEFINVTFLPEFDFIPGSITNILSFENCDFKGFRGILNQESPNFLYLQNFFLGVQTYK